MSLDSPHRSATRLRELTPSDDVAAFEQLLSGREGEDDDGVEVETLAEHPEEVARHKVLRDDVQGLTPRLQRQTSK